MHIQKKKKPLKVQGGHDKNFNLPSGISFHLKNRVRVLRHVSRQSMLSGSKTVCFPEANFKSDEKVLTKSYF